MDGVQSSVNPSDYTAVQQGPDPTTNNHLLSCLKEEYAVVARGLDPLGDVQRCPVNVLFPHSPHPTPPKRTIYYILLPPSKRFLPL